jgi:hypothetical protein
MEATMTTARFDLTVEELARVLVRILGSDLETLANFQDWLLKIGWRPAESFTQQQQAAVARAAASVVSMVLAGEVPGELTDSEEDMVAFLRDLTEEELLESCGVGV